MVTEGYQKGVYLRLRKEPAAVSQNGVQVAAETPPAGQVISKGRDGSELFVFALSL
jgi:hypothetical protein